MNYAGVKMSIFLGLQRAETCLCQSTHRGCHSLLIFAGQLDVIERVGAKDAAKELGKNIYDTVMSLEYKNTTTNNKMQVVLSLIYA
jgi:hypothetical protein